jgi:hypothetical protein
MALDPMREKFAESILLCGGKPAVLTEVSMMLAASRVVVLAPLASVPDETRGPVILAACSKTGQNGAEKLVDTFAAMKATAPAAPSGK